MLKGKKGREGVSGAGGKPIGLERVNGFEETARRRIEEARGLLLEPVMRERRGR